MRLIHTLQVEQVLQLTSGAISIGQAVATTDTVTFAGVTSDVTGDLNR